MSKIFLITEYYPYGNAETSFLEVEVKRLAEKFNDITIISNASKEYIDKENVLVELPDNVVHYNILPEKVKSLTKIKYSIRALFNKFFWKEIRYLFQGGLKKAKVRFINALSLFVRSEIFYQSLLDLSVIGRETEGVIYTYWYSYYTLAVLFHKKQFTNMRVITRAHGIDLYNDRQISGRLAYRESMRDVLDGIFFISEQGREYYAKVYSAGNILPSYFVCRLGVPKAVCLNPLNEGKVFELVSCSSVIPVKRLNLIIEGLALIKEINIHWTHFGGGFLLEEIEKLAEEILGKKENITFTFKGNRANSDIIDYFATTPIDCFITTSESEGLPVSIMEALSFGIPIIATNVGSIYEEIDENGILIPANPTPEIVMNSIVKICRLSKEDLKIMRNNSYRIWLEKFNSEKNAHFFVDQVEKYL